MQSIVDEKRKKGITELMEKTNMNRGKVEKLYDMGIKSFDNLIDVTLISIEELTDDKLPEKNDKDAHMSKETSEKKDEEIYFECPLCKTKVGEYDKECPNCKAHFAQGEIEDV